MKSREQWTWTRVAGVALIATVGLGYLGNRIPLESALQRVEGLGFWGPFAFVALLVCAPGLVLNIAGGALFGVVFGSLWSTLGSTLGAIAAFEAARILGRERLPKRLRERADDLNAAVECEGFKVVLLTRLGPGLPFNVFNYAFGLTKVSFRDYALGTLAGTLPYRILFAYIGSAAGSVATLRGGAAAMSGSHWTLLAAGVIAAALISWWLARIAKRAGGSCMTASRPPT